MAPGFHTVWLSGSSWVARDFKVAPGPFLGGCGSLGQGPSELYEDEGTLVKYHCWVPRQVFFCHVTHGTCSFKGVQYKDPRGSYGSSVAPMSQQVGGAVADGRTPDLCAGPIPPWSGSGWCSVVVGAALLTLRDHEWPGHPSRPQLGLEKASYWEA